MTRAEALQLIARERSQQPQQLLPVGLDDEDLTLHQAAVLCAGSPSTLSCFVRKLHQEGLKSPKNQQCKWLVLFDGQVCVSGEKVLALIAELFQN